MAFPPQFAKKTPGVLTSTPGKKKPKGDDKAALLALAARLKGASGA